MEKRIKRIKENAEIGANIILNIYNKIETGDSTEKINQIAREGFEKHTAEPSAKFLGSDNYLSVSINEEVLFGEISEDKQLKQGDVLSLGLGVFKDGYFADLGFSFSVDKEENENLISGNAKAFVSAIDSLQAGETVENISENIESTLEKNDLHPICEVCGHGVGRKLHEKPTIPNCTGLDFVDYEYEFKENEVVCIEPLAAKESYSGIKKNGLKFSLSENNISSHFELPVLIKESGADVFGNQLLHKYIKRSSSD